jgi:hypothetical protein
LFGEARRLLEETFDLIGETIPRVLNGEQYVNYENVRAYFTELADLLDSAVTAVGVFNDWHQDMLSAY